MRRVRVRPLWRRRLANRVAILVCLGLALAAVWPLLSVLLQVWTNGHAGVTRDFLTQGPAQDITTLQRTGGIKHAILGSLIVVALGTLIGAPLGLVTGVFLAETGRGRAVGLVRTVSDVMAGTPSIVAGLFGAATVVAINDAFSAWAAAVALALLMVPTIARTTEEALRNVPNSYREAALALGAPQWKTLVRVVLPSGAPSIATGLILGVARIAGETAPLIVTMVTALTVVTDPGKSMATLPTLIYEYGRAAAPELRQQAWAAALVLITGILGLNLVVRLLARRRST